MEQNYIRQVAEYVIADHTIEETATHFNKSTSSIKKYLAKIRNVSDADRNAGFMKAVQDSVQKIIYKVQELQMMM